jgi:hypothetical protein
LLSHRERPRIGLHHPRRQHGKIPAHLWEDTFMSEESASLRPVVALGYESQLRGERD